MLNPLRSFTHRLGISPLMWRARRKARLQNARLAFEHGAIRWESEDWVVLFPPDPYRIHYALTCVDNIIESAIPERRGGQRWIDARDAVQYRYPSGGHYWSISPPERANTLRGYLARGAPGLGDVVLDVGAYVGETSIEMSRLVGAHGHVHALEPDAQNLSLMQRNLAFHDITNVSVHPWGLWHSNGTASFVDGRGCASMLRAAISPTINIQRCTEIQTISPHDLFREIGVAPSFIKMDIEGVEVEIIPALADYYASRSLPVRIAIASYHVRDGRPTSDIITPILEAAGFSVETGYPEHQTTWAWRT